jgi:hypothetical protein
LVTRYFFPEATEQVENAFLIRMYPTSIKWSRHFILTLIQSNFASSFTEDPIWFNDGWDAKIVSEVNAGGRVRSPVHAKIYLSRSP